MTMYALIRALGLVAYGVFSLSLALGLASTSGGGTLRAIDRRAVRQLLHRSTAVVGLLVLALHVLLTILDTYIATPLSAVLIPFTSSYDTVALGIGSIALYAFVLATVSGALRLATARMISERGWRWLHRSAYAGWSLALLHGILAGPDTREPWALFVYASGVLVVMIGWIVRLRGNSRLWHRDRDGVLGGRGIR
ncbi:hypothetical protein ABCS02_20635 [Microbacterium sp. X-17]|uniref:hypothetical protein n=1 Tax=Microbacterium sp. X-17 TaxID=3144404 RepID=UPI0031F5BF9D